MPDERLVSAFFADTFRQWTSRELIAIGTSQPRVFAPGTNWAYSHTNYVILGQALEKITGKSLATLLRENILAPLGLKDTHSVATAQMREPTTGFGSPPSLFAGPALIGLATRLTAHLRAAQPVNRAQTAAARQGITPPAARALQTRWDSVIFLRVAGMALGIVGLGLCALWLR
ncbi:serine hydrolase domain-containing protein [Deinococcus sp. QL22]|uniref:serine hydrolase domain-containing protein n=1 Tax=Deinococcus sp. QL22 TaxID=2939437 RepID=UPI0020171915|nr:serine hydrolase domain-containing protein [Deinococcus sp. QL22]UQN08704.1 beta-lactamase family protein [Deinococcus sp. QL22]